jgi:UDP-N-acetylmuramate dehydrogenase
MNDEMLQEIQKIVAGNCRFADPVCNYASIGVGGRADCLAFPDDPEGLGRLVALLAAHRIPFFPAGNWTNLIVRDGGYRGVIISLKNIRTVSLRQDATGRPAIYAQAGANLADLVSLSVREGLTGLEFCAGIPGSVGGAVRMNAGAYGREMKDVIHAVVLMDRCGRVGEYPRESLPFHYRRLDLPDGSLVVSATYGLSAGARAAIRERIREILAKRKGKHPLDQKNAGSIFQNPPEGPAGRIIEAAGLKGLRVGGAQVSEKHANFIVNLGNARAKDITTLIDIIRDKVLTAQGIRLEPEVVIVGEEE